MQRSESEGIFDSLKLNPHDFVEAAIDDVNRSVRNAFDLYYRAASTHLKTEEHGRSQDLINGVNYIRNLIQSDLNEQLGVWRIDCVQRCFMVPEGFSLPKSEDLKSNNLAIDDAIRDDSDLDAQLGSLREKLSSVDAECAKLNSELQELKRQFSSTDRRRAKIVDEALQPYESNADEMFQDMIKTASKLVGKMKKMKTKSVENIERDRVEKLYNPDIYSILQKKGTASANLDDLQLLLSELKKF